MLESLPLVVPTFPRVSDYFGAWAYEPGRFGAQWRLIASADLVRHVAAGPQQRSSNVTTVEGNDGSTVAVVNVIGSLMKQQSSFGGTSTIQLRRDIRAAAADKAVSGILLAIDSPGGTVAGTADLAADIRAAARKKPVWAHVDDMAASAAYWLASQADMIFANNATALVGSIGTIMTVYDVSKAAEADGIKAHVFATGPLKGAGTPGTELTAEQADYFQNIVDDAQKSFDAAVKSGRGLDAQQLAVIRSGEVFSAPTALDRKLIDGIQSLDKTLSQLIQTK